MSFVTRQVLPSSPGGETGFKHAYPSLEDAQLYYALAQGNAPLHFVQVWNLNSGKG
jgi:hypothetical protein